MPVDLFAIRQGVLGPREQLEIHVTLRPTKDDPEEMKDKFLSGPGDGIGDKDRDGRVHIEVVELKPHDWLGGDHHSRVMA